ncbi:helix-turn-helix domain-containing protein [Actinokineospora sp. NPDC004072]
MAESNATVPKRQLGRALQQLREDAKVTRDEVADRLGCSVSKVGRIENGLVGVQALEIRELIAMFKVDAKQAAELEQMARDTRKRRPRTTYGKSVPDWFRRYRDLEQVATEIRRYDNELVPGLLQTEDYARAVTLASPLHGIAEVDQLVRARVARQGRLQDDDAPHFWTIMSEGVLRTQVGGRDVLQAQLGHILDLAERPNITVQVTPFSAGAHAATGFGFVLLRFADSVGVDVVYQEDLTSASYLDKADDPNRQQYVHVWEHLVAAALSPKASAALIHTVRREL